MRGREEQRGERRDGGSTGGRNGEMEARREEGMDERRKGDRDGGGEGDRDVGRTGCFLLFKFMLQKVGKVKVHTVSPFYVFLKAGVFKVFHEVVMFSFRLFKSANYV